MDYEFTYAKKNFQDLKIITNYNSYSIAVYFVLYLFHKEQKTCILPCNNAYLKPRTIRNIKSRADQNKAIRNPTITYFNLVLVQSFNYNI